MPAAPHDVSLEELKVLGAFSRGACQSLVMLEDPSGKPGATLTARIFHADAAVTLGHDALIRRQREISRALPPSLWVPMTAAVVKSKGAVGEILAARMTATLAQMLNAGPFDMKASQFVTACLVVRRRSAPCDASLSLCMARRQHQPAVSPLEQLHIAVIATVRMQYMANRSSCTDSAESCEAPAAAGRM